MKELTEQDFERAAKRLRCEKAAIKAVANTESAGKGFYADGFPVILFERHLFRKFTQGRYSKQFPELSGSAGNYGAAGANQRRKFNMAFALSPDAAMKSCSWGKFQILGSNHKVCGYDTVGEFVDAIKESEGKHLDAFVSFVIGNHLDGHLRSKNWAAFASGYNGKGYRKNNYDVKMAKAYVRFSATSTKPANDSEPQITSDVSPDPSESLPIETTTVEASDGSSAVSVTTTTNQQDINVPAEIESAKPYNEIGLKDTLKNDAKSILPANIGLQTVSEWIQQTTGWPPWVSALLPKLAIVAVCVTVVWILYRFAAWGMHHWAEKERIRLMAMINSDVSRRDVTIT